MENKLLRRLSVIMAFVVLFSSTGFGMVTHTCRITQKKAFFVKDTKACCSTKTVKTASSCKEASCCTVKKSFNKVSANQNFAVKLKVQQPIVPLSGAVKLHYAAQSITLQNVIEAPQFANPPPLYGRGLLVCIQSFLI